MTRRRTLRAAATLAAILALPCAAGAGGSSPKPPAPFASKTENKAANKPEQAKPEPKSADLAASNDELSTEAPKKSESKAAAPPPPLVPALPKGVKAKKKATKK